MKPQHTKRVVLVLALAALGAPYVGAQEHGLAPVLAGLRSARDIPGGAQLLLAAAEGRAEPLFAALTSDGALTDLQRTALELALAALPRERAFAPLLVVARAADNEDERVAALTLLARLGTRAELALALELGAADEAGTPAPRTREIGLQRALRGILAREPGALQTLEELFPRADPSTRATIVHTLGECAGQEAAAHLAAALGAADAATKALLLVELGRVAGLGSGLDDPAVSEHVRAELGSADPALVVLACGALEKLRDQAAVPDLIVLLGEADPNLRKSAHTALERLTGAGLAADEGAWLAWLDEAFAWWDTRAETCRVALVSGTAAEAAAALGEFAHQCFRRDQVIEALELALWRKEPDLVQAALTALGTIDDPRARLALQRFQDTAAAGLEGHARAALLRADQRCAQAAQRTIPRMPQRLKRTP